MVRWGATVVWFHATDADSVLVFASAGFRNPFVHPIALSADDTDRWAVFAERLADTPSPGSSASRRSSLADPLSDTAHVILGAGDVILETTISRDGVALRMNIGANRQDGVLTTIFPDGGAAAAAALHDAARTARSLHSTAVAEAAASAIPAAGEARSPGAAPAPTEIAAATLPAAPALTPAATTTTPPLAARHPATVADASGNAGTPAVVRARHKTSTRSAAASAANPAGSVANAASQTIVGVSVHTATPTLGAPTSSPPAQVSGAHSSAHLSAVSLVAPTPGLAPVVVSATSVPATIAAGDRGPAGVDDVTVRNLVRQWQPELMYCYTEYGLRSNPDLVGTVAVRVTLAPDGSVSHAAIARHSWSGGDAADVENCIRNRASAWHFPPASSSSMHEFPLKFER